VWRAKFGARPEKSILCKQDTNFGTPQAASGFAVDPVEVDEPDLEAVFLHLTGKALRD